MPDLDDLPPPDAPLSSEEFSYSLACDVLDMIAKLPDKASQTEVLNRLRATIDGWLGQEIIRAATVLPPTLPRR